MIFKFICSWMSVWWHLKFTFQSGDIQISQFEIKTLDENGHLHSNLVIFKLCWIIYPFGFFHSFTFQSGDIQIDEATLSTIIDIAVLHSNLVIFKFSHLSKHIHLPISFTFQSGDIQILLYVCVAVSRVSFTFQSGDIQIYHLI